MSRVIRAIPTGRENTTAASWSQIRDMHSIIPSGFRAFSAAGWSWSKAIKGDVESVLMPQAVDIACALIGFSSIQSPTEGAIGRLKTDALFRRESIIEAGAGANTQTVLRTAAKKVAKQVLARSVVGIAFASAYDGLGF